MAHDPLNLSTTMTLMIINLYNDIFSDSAISHTKNNFGKSTNNDANYDIQNVVDEFICVYRHDDT